MHVKITRSGGREYVKLVESFRNERGVSTQRVIATLGRIESVRAGAGDALINGLLRASGQNELPAAQARFETALSVGDTWLLTALWRELGFEDGFRRVLRRHRQFDAERMLRVMVFNRLCDPQSKLGVMRWLEGTRVPDVPADSVTHQRLLRTMDTLEEQADAMQSSFAALMRPLIDQELSIVFYDLTTIRTEGASQIASRDLRAYGMAKGGLVERQVVLGVVQTAEGLPIHHEVFAGNVAETRTLVPTIERVLERFAIRRVVLVADRGLLSLDNLEEIGRIRIGEQPLEFILAVPARRYGEFDELLATFQREVAADATEEVFGELRWQGHRLIVAHQPEVAAEMTVRRDGAIAELEQQAVRLAGKLDRQDGGQTHRGRRLSDGGATARFYQAVCEARLASIIKVDLKSDLFAYEIDPRALARARMMDGKLLVITNMADHTAPDIIGRYKALADIERGFRVLKSEIEIAPVFHRLPERIRAHSMICFLALVLHRVMRMRLKAHDDSGISPQRALEIARRIQFHQVALGAGRTASGLSATTELHKDLFAQLELPLPTAEAL